MSVSSGAVAGDLLEREVELAAAERALDRAATGAGDVLVLRGPAGIGKSELLAAMEASALARGFGVLRARGSELEEEIAFGIARQLFQPIFRGPPATERRRLLAGVARIGAQALGMEMGEPPADRFAAIHGLFWLCANRAERGPLVLAVDDVQWADDPSLAWLGYLTRRIGDLPVLLLLALRAGDPSGDRHGVAHLVAKRDATPMVLGPLSAGAVATLVRRQLDVGAEDPFCAAISELSSGNPLLVRELVTAAREQNLPACGDSVEALQRSAPAAVGASVLARLGRLGAEAEALARAVAILGARTEVLLAAQLAGLDPVAAELTADRLAAAQILAPVRPLEFSHPLIGAAVQADIAPGALRIAHRRAAELLETEGEAALGHVAAHLLESAPARDRWVVDRLRDAALEALELGAPEIAARYARRALAEPPTADQRASLLYLLGTAEWRAGQPNSIPHLEQALALADEDLPTLIGACSALAPAYNVTDQAERAVEVLERALLAVAGTDAGLALTAETAIAMVGMANERTAPAALRRAQVLRARLSTVADPPAHLVVMSASYAARGNRASETQELAQRALACDPYPPSLDICNVLIFVLRLVESYDALHRLCEDLLAAARRRGAVQELVGISVFRASAWYECGALADAEADARWALERADGVHLIHAVSEVIRVLIERDELEAADRVLEECVDPLASRSIRLVPFLLARGQLRAAQGCLREALEDFLECGRRCEPLGLSTVSALPWRAEAAVIYAALGDREQARRLASEQLRLARAFGRPRTLGISLRASGLAEGGERGLELLSEAVNTLEGSQSPLELARGRCDYGAALRRAGRRVEARTALERALDGAHHCGARRLAARTRAELIAVGAKPRRDAITGRDALTAGELRVARLAAEGLTNREIAQALFITTKTAKAHLNRVYRKLGIARRGQLASALTGLLDDNREEDANIAVSAIS